MSSACRREVVSARTVFRFDGMWAMVFAAGSDRP